MLKHLWCCVGLFSIGSFFANDTKSLIAPEYFTTHYNDEFSNTIQIRCNRVASTCQHDDSGHESCYYICTNTPIDSPQKTDAAFHSFLHHAALSNALVMVANFTLAARFARNYRNGTHPWDRSWIKLLATAGLAASLSGLHWAIAGYPADNSLCMFLLSYSLGAITGPL
jgi:hypothetical protein